MLKKEWLGKVVTIYLSNRRYFKGILEDIGDGYAEVNKVRFNTDHIISASVVEKNHDK